MLRAESSSTATPTKVSEARHAQPAAARSQCRHSPAVPPASAFEQTGPTNLPLGCSPALSSAVLGPGPKQYRTRIMVTMPSEASADPVIVEELLDQGMDIMCGSTSLRVTNRGIFLCSLRSAPAPRPLTRRPPCSPPPEPRRRVNCAHDGPAQWAAMVDNLRAAEKKGAPHPRATAARRTEATSCDDLARPHGSLRARATPNAVGRTSKVSFDLAGPKLRTESVTDGPAVRRRLCVSISLPFLLSRERAGLALRLCIL